jgi:hypothetical protein
MDLEAEDELPYLAITNAYAKISDGNSATLGGLRPNMKLL